jgi:cyclopropane-fatty-acyl-phospholipid synthase
MLVLDKLLTRSIRHGALELVDPSGARRRYGEPTAQPVIVRLGDDATARAIGRNPALGAGEAYMDGRLTFEQGTIWNLVDLLGRNLRWDRDNSLRVSLWGQARVAAWWDQRNYRTRARRNVAHHYDLGDDLYDLFLDRERQYSCAYFADDNRGTGPLGEGSDLDRAQRDKMARIAAKLDLKPGQRVLDIGCGWGGLSRFLHRVAGVEVVGVTLSTEQHATAIRRSVEEGMGDALTYRLMDYRDVEGPFDRIVSVGMFEHVGRPNYRSFFDKVASLLAPDGVALLHTIGRMGGPGATDPWTAKYIFPGGYTPALSEMAPAIERAWLWMTDIEVWRLHYAYTLAHWDRRCQAARERIIARYDETFMRMWEFYLAGAHSAFANDDHVVYQIQLARQRDGVPLTRGYIGETEKAFRAKAG